jgi:hypothetical protein
MDRLKDGTSNRLRSRVNKRPSPTSPPVPFTVMKRMFHSKIMTMLIIAAFWIVAVMTAVELSISGTPHTLAQTSVPPTPIINDDVTISISPATTQVYAGGIGTTRIALVTDQPINTVTLQLKFDPAIISVLDANLTEPGIQVGIDSQLGNVDTKIHYNRVDNNAGIIEVKLGDLKTTTPESSILAITWWGQQEGAATLSVIEATLVTRDQEKVATNSSGSIIKVTSAPEDPIFGRVLLDGRSKFDGTIVYATAEQCPETPQSEQSIIVGVPVDVTDSDGYFEIIPDNVESVGCIQVAQEGYLVGQQTAPQGNLGTITLPGGDTNFDNMVNIFDLAFIGSRYGDNNTGADINLDNIVNIFDLVIAANNYGLVGPTTEWR